MHVLDHVIERCVWLLIYIPRCTLSIDLIMPPHPPLKLIIFVATELPTKENAERSSFPMTTVRMDYPYDDFAFNAREQLQARYPRYAGFALYRVHFLFLLLEAVTKRS